MNAKACGKMRQNSPPPQESTSPPARPIASQRGSADRTKSSAVAASTSSTAHTSATISRRESAGRSASESRSTVKRYARPAAPVLICRDHVGSSSVHVRPSQGITTPAHVLLGGCTGPGSIGHFDGGQDRQLVERTGLRIVRHCPPEWPVALDRIAVLAAVGQISTACRPAEPLLDAVRGRRHSCLLQQIAGKAQDVLVLEPQ